MGGRCVHLLEKLRGPPLLCHACMKGKVLLYGNSNECLTTEEINWRQITGRPTRIDGRQFFVSMMHEIDSVHQLPKTP